MAGLFIEGGLTQNCCITQFFRVGEKGREREREKRGFHCLVKNCQTCLQDVVPFEFNRKRHKSVCIFQYFFCSTPAAERAVKQWIYLMILSRDMVSILSRYSRPSRLITAQSLLQAKRWSVVAGRWFTMHTLTEPQRGVLTRTEMVWFGALFRRAPALHT